MVRVEHPDVTLSEFTLHPRGFLAGLRPACGHTDCEKDGNVGRSERRTGQRRPDPMCNDGPHGRRSWRWCGFGALDAPPNGFLKTRRERSVRAPLLEHVAEGLVVIAWFVGLHITSTKGGGSQPPPITVYPSET